MPIKQCNKCKTDQPTDNFYKDRSRKDGYGVYCKTCSRRTAQKWKNLNSQQYTTKSKEWRENNKQYTTNYNKNWLKNNTEYKKQLDKQYRLTHSAQIKQYLKDNAGKVNARNAIRRAAKLQATPIWFEKDNVCILYERVNYLNHIWGQDFQVDHIIPLINDHVCGLHCWHNLQVLKRTLNCSKNNNYQIDW